MPPAKLREGGLTTFEETPAAQPQRRRDEVRRGRRPHGDDRHPADPRRGPPDARHASAPTRATSCSASRSWPPAARTSRSRSPAPERLVTTADSIVPEAACTSTQFHVQTSPDQFAAYWNASQAIAAVQLAVGANSPYLLGKELWRETRIPLFEQATDTRSEELKAQGVRPRVWFGERWITSVFDLFEENVRYFPALLPITEDEDPLEVLEAGGTPQLAELRLHNGTIYRWNRPVYDIAGGVPAPAGREPRPRRRADRRRHDGQRRVLLRPGPRPRRERAAAVVADVVQRRRGELPRRRASRASTPRSTGRASARCGPPSWCCAGCCRWPTRGWRPGASRPTERDRLLGIIEQRCLTGHQRRGVVRRAGCTQRSRPRPVRRAAGHAAGVPRAHAHQRAGAHLGVTASAPAQPLPLPARRRCAGPTSPCRVTTTIVSVTPASAYAAAAAGEPRGVDVLRGSSSPGRVSHTERLDRPGRGCARSRAATMSARSAWSVGSSRRGSSASPTPSGHADVEHRREDAGAAPDRGSPARPAGAARASAGGSGVRVRVRASGRRACPTRRPRRRLLHRLPHGPRIRYRAGGTDRSRVASTRRRRWEPSWWATCPSRRARPR